jgi:hypothetical protein
MTTTLNITTNFVGNVAGDYIAAMIKESNTISQNLVTILPNIVSKTYLRKINTIDGFVDYVCGFTPSGSVILSEYEITPKKIKWDAELCIVDSSRNGFFCSQRFFASNRTSCNTFGHG